MAPKWPRVAPKRPREWVFQGIFQSSEIVHLQGFSKSGPTRERNHNPRVGGSSPSSGITKGLQGTQVLIPHDSSRRKDTRARWNGGAHDFMRSAPATEHDKQRAQRGGRADDGSDDKVAERLSRSR
jgi:hypothetical protein